MTTPEGSRAALHTLLAERIGERAAWLDAHQATPIADLSEVLGEVRRAVGARPLVGDFQRRAQASVPTAWGEMKVGRWSTDLAARILVLAGAAQATEAPGAALYEAYDRGDTETRTAVLHAINFVDDPNPAKALETIADAGRTYLEVLMDAAWCDNPFTTAHLTDQQYRKAVLKALFCGIDVSRFLGLAERADAELAKSLCEFADEREAAGRPVPATVWTVAARYPRPGLVARLLGRMEHPLPSERSIAAGALGSAADPRAASFILERLERETDAEVRAALEAAVAKCKG